MLKSMSILFTTKSRRPVMRPLERVAFGNGSLANRIALWVTRLLLMRSVGGSQPASERSVKRIIWRTA